MEKLRNIYIVIFLFFIGSSFEVEAQSDLGLYGLRVVPQSNINNPVFITEGNIIIGIPFISSISNTTYSSSFSFNDIFVTKNGSDSLYLNLSRLALESKENNFVTECFENDIIYLGFRIKSNFLNLGIRNRLFSRVMYSNDLVQLLWNGNYINEVMNLSNTFVNHDHFLSYYVGYAFRADDNMSFGIRVNLNQGLSSIQMSNNQLYINTVTHDQNVFSINANTDFLINTSGISNDSTGNDISISEYIFNFKNIGFSVDFGADFKMSERVKINFSLLDLGFINWNSNLTSYKSSSDYVEFSGITTDINTTENIFEAYADSINKLIDIKKQEYKFKTFLPTRFFIGLEYYSIDKSGRLSFVFSGTDLQYNFSPAISLGYDKTVSKNLTFKVNYSYLKYAPLNLGGGLVVNLQSFQFYILTDNILSIINWRGQKYIHFRFGFNLVIRDPNSIKKRRTLMTY